MQASDIPTKFRVPFANLADSGHKSQPVPLSPPAPGRASLTDGFPPSTFIAVASGGNPPWGADMNGVLYQSTAWLRWVAAGGGVPAWDSTFKTQVGGYPKGAVVQATPIGEGRFWISLQDNNTDDPDAPVASPNWLAFPDLDVLLQRPNYGAATGAVNAMKVTLSPTPSSWAQIVGAPIRVKINHTNTSTAPTLQINGLAPAVCINPDGSAIKVGQLVLGAVMEGIPRDDNKFQVNSPAPVTSVGTPVVTGAVYIWPDNSVPSWGLECDGSTLLISEYPNLFAIIGTRWGGNGTTNFKIPDFRGYFLRGWDHGAGRDLGPRDPVSGVVGSTEGDTAGNIVFANVLATLNRPDAGGGPSSDSLYNLLVDSEGTTTAGLRASDEFQSNVNHSTKISLNTNVGSGETRPKNAAVMFVIAF